MLPFFLSLFQAMPLSQIYSKKGIDYKTNLSYPTAKAKALNQIKEQFPWIKILSSFFSQTYF